MSRVPYLELTDTQQRAIWDWLAQHNVDHCDVPVLARFEQDPATGEWLIPVLKRTGGKLRLVNGEVPAAILRRAPKSDLPWPE